MRKIRKRYWQPPEDLAYLLDMPIQEVIGKQLSSLWPMCVSKVVKYSLLNWPYMHHSGGKVIPRSMEDDIISAIDAKYGMQSLRIYLVF